MRTAIFLAVAILLAGCSGKWEPRPVGNQFNRPMETSVPEFGE